MIIKALKKDAKIYLKYLGEILLIWVTYLYLRTNLLKWTNFLVKIMALEKSNQEEGLLDFVRRVKLHRLLPVGSPSEIAETLEKSENSVRGVSKGHWGDIDILEAVASKLEHCGSVGKELREKLDAIKLPATKAA
jgi:hypothetical protein